MAQILTPSLRCQRSTKVARIRALPLPGQVLKKVGDQVSSNEIVAQAERPGELTILRISEQMGIEPFEVMAGIKVKLGQEVIAGEVLCEHKGLFGLFRSTFESPASGRVDLITERTGHIGIRHRATAISVNAYLTGVVSQVDPGKSVTIESQAALVQGIFGIGGERIGQIRLLDVKLDQLISSELIPPGVEGSVLIGGMGVTYDALRKAADLGAVGLVTGSIDDKVLSQFLGYDIGIALTGDEKISTTVIITEGFGQLAMSARVINALSGLDGQMAAINGATQVRAGAVRPEIIVCGQPPIGSGELEAESIGLGVGAKIRLIRYPYFGQFAEVLELPNNLVAIETGALVRVLTAKTTQGDLVTVPRANVELVG